MTQITQAIQDLINNSNLTEEQILEILQEQSERQARNNKSDFKNSLNQILAEKVRAMVDSAIRTVDLDKLVSARVQQNIEAQANELLKSKLRSTILDQITEQKEAIVDATNDYLQQLTVVHADTLYQLEQDSEELKNLND